MRPKTKEREMDSCPLAVMITKGITQHPSFTDQQPTPHSRLRRHPAAQARLSKSGSTARGPDVAATKPWLISKYDLLPQPSPECDCSRQRGKRKGRSSTLAAPAPHSLICPQPSTESALQSPDRPFLPPRPRQGIQAVPQSTHTPVLLSSHSVSSVGSTSPHPHSPPGPLPPHAALALSGLRSGPHCPPLPARSLTCLSPSGQLTEATLAPPGTAPSRNPVGPLLPHRTLLSPTYLSCWI